MEVNVRPLAPTDDIVGLTDLLHRAYAQLAEMGLRFMATHQDESITRQRIQGAECFVAEVDGAIGGTIALRGPGCSNGCPWYDQPHVATFGQFGVEPSLQGSGVGSRLLQRVEDRAREMGALELALDTAEPASHLIELYTRKGFRMVGRVKWDSVNYHSVIMSKRL